MIRMLFLLRTRPLSIFSLTKMFGEDHLKARLDAIRIGLSAGSFVGLYELTDYCIDSWRLRTKYFKNRWIFTIVSGFVSGLSIYFQVPSFRRVIALYALARVSQCIYFSLRERGMVPDIPHGDALVFAMSSAHIMYSYVMRKDALEPSFWTFIHRTGPLEGFVVKSVCQNNRGDPIDIESINRRTLELWSGDQTPKLLQTQFPSIIGCDHLHPTCPNCWMNYVRVFFSTAYRILPQYSAIAIVPVLVFRYQKLMRNPVSMTFSTFLSIMRSISFLSTFVALYQAGVCAWRNTFERDHRILYYLAGWLCSLSVFIERKSRRSELALYTLPRAVNSLFNQMVDHKMMVSVPHGDSLLFCLATSGLMYFYHEEPEHSSSLVNGLFRFLFEL